MKKSVHLLLRPGRLTEAGLEINRLIITAVADTVHDLYNEHFLG